MPLKTPIVRLLRLFSINFLNHYLEYVSLSRVFGWLFIDVEIHAQANLYLKLKECITLTRSTKIESTEHAYSHVFLTQDSRYLIKSTRIREAKESIREYRRKDVSHMERKGVRRKAASSGTRSKTVGHESGRFIVDADDIVGRK